MTIPLRIGQRCLPVILAYALSMAALAVAQEATPPAASPLDKLKAEYDEALGEWSAKYRSDRNTPAAQLIERYDAWPGWSFAPRIARLGTSDPTGQHAFEALQWFVELANNVGSADRGYCVYDEQVCQALLDHHLANPEFAALLGNLSDYPTPARETLLRECVDKGGTRELRGLACFYLAQCLENKGRLAFEIAAGRYANGDEFLKHLVGRESPAFIAYIQLTDSTLALAEAKSCEERVLDEFDDVPARRGHVFAPAEPTLGYMVRLGRAQAAPATIGQPVPELSGPDLAGQPRKLSDCLGKVIVLHFWATWNRQSLKRLPQLQQLAARHAGEPFCILGVNCDPDPQVAAKFVTDRGLSWPTWSAQSLGPAIGHFSPGSRESAVIVLDHQGVLRYQDPTGEELNQAVETLLAEAKP